MAWRLGIDLGTNSLGWWAFSLAPNGQGWQIADSLDGGVYVFPDGREPAKGGRVGDSNAVNRRLARSMRRNRDRRKTRMKAFMRELISLGLMPDDPDQRGALFRSAPGNSGDPDRYNPYRLRTEALQRPLERFELGRALLHLGLRRGFKSNRLDQSEDDGGNLKESIAELDAALDGMTLGQFQWHRYLEQKKAGYSVSPPAGIRFRGRDGFYPERTMHAQEFDAICAAQTPHHGLTANDWQRLRDRYVLFQWPLKPVERGACEFIPDEPRHWRDTPIGHDFRIFQELNNLRWIDADHGEHGLNVEQRAGILNLLMTRKSKVPFSTMLKLKGADRTPLFPDAHRFNLQSVRRKDLQPHTIGAVFRADPVLAPLWEKRQSESGDGGRLDDIFCALHEEADRDALCERLASEFSLDASAIERLLAIRPAKATASVSRRFMEAIVPVMRDQGLVYADAVRELPDGEGGILHHSQRTQVGERTKLPYYGEILRGAMLGADPAADPVAQPESHFGRINNPTVHVALNSLRRVVNTLIERFGEPPAQVHIELARELKRTRQERDADAARQARNERENNRIREELARHGVANASALDVKKVKLWEELGENNFARQCPFSGRNISFAQLLNGEAEIEHILPFKRTLDDSMANLTVALRWANRIKGNRTPYEAFADDAHRADGIEWETVRSIAERLPANKAWRFGPDAMARFETDNDFIARQLTDNAYIARAATQYLNCLKGVEQVVPNRGGLTALLRGKWDFNGILSDDNRKSREDHRHHAVDAAVIGLADRATLNQVSRLTARSADDRVRIEVPRLPDHLTESIRQRVKSITVAYKPDHGHQGGMFKETAYGFVPSDRRDPDLPEHNLVVRKPLSALTDKELSCIRDASLRQKVRDFLAEAMSEGMKREKALTEFSIRTGVRHARILVTDQTVKPVPSAPYKGYKPDSYVCCDVWRVPKGRKGNWRRGEYHWRGEYWSYAETAGGIPEPATRKPHPAAKFVGRFFKNDLIAFQDDGRDVLCRVAGFSTTNNKLDVVPHNLAEPERNYVSINVLGAKELRKVKVLPDGRVLGLARPKKP